MACISAAAIACDPDPNPEPPPLRVIEKSSALAAANNNLRAVLIGSARASAVVGRSAVLDQLADQTGECAAGDCLDNQLENDAEETADEIAERVLNVANIEVEEEKRIVLKLIPERVCAEGSSTVDAECVRMLTEVPVRIELTSRVENDIDIALLIDDAQLRPATLQLHRSMLGLELDLGAAKMAAISFLTAAGESTSEVPSTLSGRIRLALEKNADLDYTASFHVLAPIAVALEDMSFNVTAASPATSIRFDAILEQITHKASFGEISGRLPLALVYGSDDCVDSPNGPVCEPNDPPAGEVGFKIGAMRSTTVVGANQDALAIEDINFGSGIQLTIDNLPLISFDADVDRVSIMGTDDGLKIAVSPSLNAVLGLDFQNIVDRVMDIPSFLMNEELSFRLDGAAEPSVGFSDDENAIEMLAGTMNIHSRAAGRSVEVAAGQCLLVDETKDVDQVQHPIELLSAGMCPSM
jgi:hypothetical protein